MKIPLFSRVIVWLSAAVFGGAEITGGGKRLFTAVMRDITDRKRAAEVLQTSETSYRLLFDSNPNPVLVFDLETLEILAVNQEAVRQYGYSNEEFMMMSIKDIRPPEYIPDMLDQVAVCAGSQDKSIHNTRHQRRDGSIFDVEIAAHPIPFGGRAARLVLITDITERSRAKEELQQNLSLLTSTFEATAEGILVVDLNNKIVTCNQNFVEMAGIPDDVMTSKDNDKVISFVLEKLIDPESFIEKTKELVLRPETNSHDIIGFKDGRIFERYSHPQRLDGEVVGRVVSFRDITAGKRSEIESQVISEIIQGVAMTPNLEAFLALVQKSISRIIYAKNFYVALHDEETGMLNVPFWVDKFDDCAPPQKLGRGLTAYAIRRGSPTLLKEADVNRLIEEGEIESVGTSSAIWLGIPLKTPDGIVGVLVVQHYEDAYAYTERDIEIMASAAGQITLAIQRKRAEEALRQSEEKHRTILETIEEGYYELDLAGNFTFVNEAMVSSFRYSKEELAGLNYRSYVDKETAGNLFQAYNRVFATGKPVSNLAFEIIRKDGTNMPSETSIVLRHDAEGKPIGFRGVVRDVTENKLVEAELRSSEARFQSAFDFAPIGIGLMAPNGQWRQVNNSLCDIIGYTEERLLQTSFQHILHPDDFTESRGYLRQLLDEDNTTYQFENRLIHKLGHEVIALTSVSLARDGQNNPLHFIAQIQDISERKRIEEDMRANDLRLSEAQRIAHIGSWEWNIAENTVVWSDETHRIFGFEPGQVDVSYDLFFNSVHPDDRKHVSEVLADTIEHRKIFNIEHRAIMPDKSERIVLGKAELVLDERSGEPLKLIGTLQDITERRRTDAALRESEFKLRTLFSNMNEGLAQVNQKEVIEFVNDRLCEITGYGRDEMLGKKTLDLLFDDEGRRLVANANEERKKGISGQYEAQIRKKSGELLWVLVSGAPIINEDGKLTGTLGMFMDISERKRIEDQLLHDAFHDVLTGLANRALFMDHLRMTIERGKSRHSNHHAVLFLDFDRFKVINDSLGHAEGDDLLKQIAGRLQALTRTGDLLARLGGDEFVILLTEMLDADDAVQVAGRIQDDLKKPFYLCGNEVFISASVGIALSTDGHRQADEMLRDADIAMYQAKAKGKARYQVFDQEMRAQATTRLQIETEMRQGLDRGEFVLHYQPIINLQTNILKGFEALVRWRHPTRGMVPPDDFIPAAEETGLILPLGRWILVESCRQMREWQDQHPQASALVINVNLSCKQFLQRDLVDQVAETLKETGLAAHSLKLEITESYLIDNSDKAVKIMNRLRKLGVELSLDDFGTGYSSLSYLHRLPLNSLKIDRSFVSRMTEKGENGQIVRTIIEMAQNLKMKVIAEGIETAEQLAQLKGLECGYGQGYFFSRPLDAELAAEFIDDNLMKYTGVTEQPIINLDMNM